MIVAAAIRVNGNIYIAKRHDILFRLFGTMMKCHPENQGFVTDNGTFLNRSDAALHAFKCRQVRRIHTLISEDLIAEDSEYSKRFQ